MTKHKLLLFTAMSTMLYAFNAFALPAGFVYLNDVDNSIIQDMRYYSANNFTGRPVPGYAAPKCILTYQAAFALHKLQERLKKQNLGLKVYDCYRPRQAVDYFIKWSRNPREQEMKLDYYPRVNKADLFKLGYVSKQSAHSRGSTVDLSLVQFIGPDKHATDVPMGTHFDYLDPSSHPFAKHITYRAKKNRMRLRMWMEQAGFKPMSTEWWHFTLRNEPFVKQSFNFPVR